LTERAAGTPVYVASSPDFDGVSGKLFLRDRDVRTKQITYDADVAVRLWNISEALYKSRTALPQTG
jgi:retinol dehydrogenase-14